MAPQEEKPLPIMTRVKNALGFKTLAAFAPEWRSLTEADREQIKTGVENGSMTY